MGKLVGTVSVLVLILSILFGIAVMNVNSLIAQNKDWIASQLEQVLARSVHFDRVGLSLTGGLGIRVLGFSVDEDPAYGEGAFLEIAEIVVRMALWPLLFGEVEIPRVALYDMSMTFIQGRDGMNIDTLGATAQSAAAGSVGQAPSASGSAFDPALVVILAELRGGEIRYFDRSVVPTESVVIEDLEFWASDLRMDGPIVFQLTGSALGGGVPNLSITGKLGPIDLLDTSRTPVSIQYKLDPIRAVDLQTLPGLSSVFAGESPFAGELVLAGEVSGSLRELSLGLRLDATNARLPYGKQVGEVLKFEAELLATPKEIEIVKADVLVGNTSVHSWGTISNLGESHLVHNLEIFGGLIKLTGDWAANGRVDLDIGVDGLRFDAMSEGMLSDGRALMEGQLAAALTVSGTGTTWNELAPGLSGTGWVRVTDGVLREINLVEETLAGLTGIPGLSGAIPDDIREEHPEVFAAGDTVFEQLEGKFKLRDGRLEIEGLEISVAGNKISGAGGLTLLGVLDLSTRVKLSKPLTEDLVRRFKALRYLRGEGRRIEIPMSISGTLPEISIQPDFDWIAKTVGAGALKHVSQKALRKALRPDVEDLGRGLLESLLK